MTDQAAPDQTKQTPPIQDITHQSVRLGRYLDRLPPGEYLFKLQKGTRHDPWHLVVSDEDGEVVREFDLWG